MTARVHGKWLTGSVAVLLLLGSGGAEAGISDAATTFQSVTPVRVFDTRSGTGGVPAQALGPGRTLDVVIGGTSGVPSTALAVSLNVTAIHGTAPSHLTAWPTGEPRPITSNLNWLGREANANAVTVALGEGGKVSFYNFLGTVQILADVFGYYSAGPAGTAGPAGPAGPAGTAGPAGATGSAGAPGVMGPAGAAGPTGLSGPAGAAGPEGSAGADGAQGLAGGAADGRSAPAGIVVSVLDGRGDPTGDDVGEHTSLTIGADGLGLISYYDRTNGDLRVAHCNDLDCRSATTGSLDTVGDVGEFTSVAIGADGLGLISYYDRSNGDLKVARCAESAIPCSSATSNILDSAGVVGEYTSITLGADGRGLISYYDVTNTNVKVAQCVSVACASATRSTLDDDPDNTTRRPEDHRLLRHRLLRADQERRRRGQHR